MLFIGEGMKTDMAIDGVEEEEEEEEKSWGPSNPGSIVSFVDHWEERVRENWSANRQGGETQLWMRLNK
jgi:hypothetical protein